MTTLNEIYPSYYNVLAYPPAILDDQNKSNWEKYVEWRKNTNTAWNEYDQNFLPDGLTKVFNDMYDAYQGNSGSYLALTQDLIRFAFIFIPVPFSSTISFGINKVLGFIFPGAKRPSLFEQIKDQVEQMIDQKLETQELNKNVAALNSINENLARFSNSIQQAFGKPQTFPVIYQSVKPLSANLDISYDCTQDTECKSCSDNPNRKIETDPPCDPPCQCRIKGVQDTYTQAVTYISGTLSNMETSLNNVIKTENMQAYLQMYLPLYTTGASLLIGLHHSYIQFATQYNFEMGPNGNTNKYMHDLNSAINKHSNYVYKLFIDYLPPLPSASNTIVQYNAYIKYKRNITINALDMVASWSFMDPFNYILPTNHTFTRIIAHDIIPNYKFPNPDCKKPDNSTSYSLLDLNQKPITNWSIDIPYFYNNTQLNSLQFKKYYSYTTNNNNCYPTGFKSSYRKESQPSINNEYGDQQDDHISLGSNIYDQDPLFNVLNIRTQNVAGGHVTGLYNINDTDFNYPKYNNYIAGCYTTGDCPYSHNNANPNQRIQAIYPLYNTNNKTVNSISFLTTLIPTDTTTKPIFTSVGINTFPAEQAISTTGTLLPEYVNGTASLKLDPGNSAQYIIDNSQILTAPQDFQVRVRVATTDNNGNLTIIVNNNTKILNIPNTSENQNANSLQVIGKQGTYMLSNMTNNISLSPNNEMSMTITNSSSIPIILDRIEFVPLSIIPTPPIHRDIPTTTTQPNKTQEIWSDSTYATGLSVKGTASNDASIVFQLYDNKNLVQEIPVQGPGHASSSMIGCYDRSGPIDQQNPTTQKYNTLVLKELSDSKYSCFKGSGDNTYAVGIDILFSTSQSNFSSAADLEKITQQVYALFTSSSHTELASNISNYQINQVVLKVSALSDEVFGKEKALLRKLVNKAKQFLKARNLLVGGDFETLNEWLLGTQATIKEDSSLFNGNHLFLQPTNGIDSSYAFQKIDESKLKPYTRYKVSGFIGQSDQLELVGSRYGKEIDTILNVPYAAALPITSGTNPTCCAPETCQCPSCDGSQPDSHFFSYSIDVGALHLELNPGIEFGLRLVHPNGSARLSNLEIVEERLLTEKEIKKVQRNEQKWKKAFDQERAEITAILQPILHQINAFYKNGDWNGSILPHVTYQDLFNVILPELPKLRHWFMEDREGEHYVILQKFKQALERVFTHLEEQNLIHNGIFANGLTDWITEGDAGITLEDGRPMLQLSQWDASVSQAIDISDFDEDKEYKLRVRGKGKGTITIQHGEEMETLSFTTKTFTTKEQSFYFEDKSVSVQIQSEGNEFIVDSVEIIEIPEEDE